MQYEVIEPGTEVAINGHPADILAVQIDGQTIKYKAAWWSGADRKEAWVYQHEIDERPAVVTIGFKFVESPLGKMTQIE